MVIRIERGADSLDMVQLMPPHRKTPPSLASFKSRLVLPFWYQLTYQISRWPDGLELTSGFYPGSNEQHRLF